MLNSDETQHSSELQDLHESQSPVRTGTLSAVEPANQIYAPTAITPGGESSEVTTGTIIDSTALIGSQEQDEDTPALPPRPPQTTAGGMPNHVADELAPPATNAPEAQHLNPIVAQLKGMFPDFDESLLYVPSVS